MDKVYCDDCRHCRPDNSLLTSWFGLNKRTAMEFAKCAAILRKPIIERHSRLTMEPKPSEMTWCSIANANNDCAAFERKV